MKSFFIIFFGVSAMRIFDHENHNFYHLGKFLYWPVSRVPYDSWDWDKNLWESQIRDEQWDWDPRTWDWDPWELEKYRWGTYWTKILGTSTPCNKYPRAKYKGQSFESLVVLLSPKKLVATVGTDVKTLGPSRDSKRLISVPWTKIFEPGSPA